MTSRNDDTASLDGDLPRRRPLLGSAPPPRLLLNPRGGGSARRALALPPILGGARFRQAWEAITAWPGYAPTPLHRLDGLARAAGLGALLYKDEGGRFGLGSFKALGGAYAVSRVLQDAPDKRSVTVACATDGNHGRSVAWGARTFGCGCVIYIHETVSVAREQAIAGYGAEVRRVPGTYDDAVRRADADARANGWTIVSDTSYPGYEDIPRDVMQGYAVMVEEALRDLATEERPTHVFVQGGVGGLAAAVCAHLAERLGAERPRLVVVEPDRADCLFRSAAAGELTAAPGDLDTVMAGLACGEPSLLAWRILDPGADAFMTIADEAALQAMRLLAEGAGGDRPVVAGESAVAGLVGAIQAAADEAMRKNLELGPQSRVLVFGTEGATDPELYASIVGRAAAEVAAGALRR
jgi:diaminopropionate ammonia-lyase